MSVSTPVSIAHPSSKSSIVVSTPLYETSRDLDSVLYPKAEAFDEGFLKVSELHTLWYAQYGNPKGTPVLVVHGGPGAGCGEDKPRYFDPQHYRIILVDQRGAMRSQPFGEMRENTTANLIADFEKLRRYLTIDRWILSWGSTLSLAYGEAHPEVVSGFILAGIYLASKENNIQIWYGMRENYPEEWEEMVAFIPAEEHADLITAYHKRLMDPAPKVHMPAARAFVKYAFAFACSPLIRSPNLQDDMQDDKLVLGVARTFTHYSVNNFFLTETQLMDNLSKIVSIPAIIVHGRLDMVTKAKSAYDLYKKWPGSKLVFIPDGVCSSFDPSFSKAIRDAADEMRVKHL